MKSLQFLYYFCILLYVPFLDKPTRHNMHIGGLQKQEKTAQNPKLVLILSLHHPFILREKCCKNLHFVNIKWFKRKKKNIQLIKAVNAWHDQISGMAHFLFIY